VGIAHGQNKKNFYNPEKVQLFQGSWIYHISFPPVSLEVIEILAFQAKKTFLIFFSFTIIKILLAIHKIIFKYNTRYSFNF